MRYKYRKVIAAIIAILAIFGLLFVSGGAEYSGFIWLYIGPLIGVLLAVWLALDIRHAIREKHVLVTFLKWLMLVVFLVLMQYVYFMLRERS